MEDFSYHHPVLSYILICLLAVVGLSLVFTITICVSNGVIEQQKVERLKAEAMICRETGYGCYGNGGSSSNSNVNIDFYNKGEK